MATIHVKENEQLHKLIEVTEKVVDQNEGNIRKLTERLDGVDGELKTTLGEVRTALEKNVEDVKTMQERLHELDKVLPKGDKVYRAVTESEESNSERAAREEFGNIIMDSVLIARRGRPKYSLYGRQQTIYDQVSASGDEGGLLVDGEYMPSITRVMQKFGVARQLFKRIPMNSNKMRIPTNATLPTVYWDSQLAERELTAPSQSGVTVGRPEMEAHKLIGIDTMSIEVMQDAVPLIRDFVVDMFLLAMAKEEDRTALVANGADSGEPFSDGGILRLSGVGSVTGSAQSYLASLQDDSSTAGGYAKLLALMDAADESAAETGTFVFSNSILNAIRQVKDTTGVPLWGQMVGSAPNTIFGRPFVRASVMPKQSDASQADKPFMIYGDFNYAFMGDRQQLRIDSSEDAAFKEYGVVLRVAERVAFKVPLKTPFAVMKTAA